VQVLNKRFKGFEFWDGAVFGAFVALEVAFITAWSWDYFDDQYWNIVSRFIAVPVSLIGAFIALTTTRFQISYNRNNDLEAWRAVLPLALSELIRISKNGLLIAADQAPVGSSPHELLKLSPEALKTLQECIRSSDPVSREWLKVLVARYQVYYVRAEGLDQSPPPSEGADGVTHFNPEREDALIDWATFFALVEHHFEYARGVSNQCDTYLNTKKISSSLKFHLLSTNFDKRFNQRLQIRIDRISDGDIRHFKFSRLA
jgi:hypothetical protein